MSNMIDRKKVIKAIEYCTDNSLVCHGDECPYWKDGVSTIVCWNNVMKDAGELLKEQEPVKPKYIDGKRNHFIMCGKCNTDLIRGMKYCSYCGQAVKWE